MSKETEILKGIVLIQQYLEFLKPEKKWDIVYAIPKDCEKKFGEWSTKYHGLINGEEYIFIFEKKTLLYAINVTGDSTLTAISELMDLLAKKF